jgi:hypothetical protein
MSDVKSAECCMRTGCMQKRDWESRFCSKHECAKCFGAGRLEPTPGVRVRCPSCDGKGEKRRVL